MDLCLIAELELEELQMKQSDFKLMFKPSLDYIIPEVDLLNFINHPEGLSNIGTFSYPTGYFYRFPACYNGRKD
jgi:hypothetical protein